MEEDKNQDEITKEEETQECEKAESEEINEGEMCKQVKQENEIIEEVQVSDDLDQNEEELQDLAQLDAEEELEIASEEETSDESKQEVEEVDEKIEEDDTKSEIVSEELEKLETDEEKKVEQEDEGKEEKSVLGISYLNVTAINDRRNKIIIISVIAVVVVVAAIISGIVFVNINKNKEENVPIEQPVVEEKKPIVPVYSEEAKQRMQNIYEWNEGEEKVAYLTFDDGPSKNITPQILDILRNQEVKATFFVLGSRVELYPELLKQEYDEGHYIANHGYSHNYPSVYETAQSVVDEYYRTESLIVSALNLPEYCSHLFRFPGGSQGGKYANIKNEAKVLLEQNDAQYINWNALTNDAVGTPTPESIINDLKITTERKK